MNPSKLKSFVKRYGAGIALCCLGVGLLVNPDSGSAFVGTVLGWALLVLAIWVAFRLVREKSFDLVRVLVVLACLWGAVSLIRNPLEVAAGVGRVAGILLLLKGCQDLMRSGRSEGRALSAFTVVLGVVLLVLPLTTSRLLFTAVAVVLIITGVTKIIEAKKGNDDSIIDAL